jgi:tetratricopeptide (TPR) repeat protein
MDLNKTIHSALEHYEAGDVKQSVGILLEILKSQPDNLDAIELLGLICYQLKDYNLAFNCFKKALQIQPTDSNAYYQLGIICEERGQVDEAVILYNKAIEHHSHIHDVYIRLGKLLEKKGQMSLALTYLKRAVELRTKIEETSNDYNVIKQTADSLNEAIVAYKKAIELNPHMPEIYDKLSLALIEKGQYEEALICSKKAIELNPHLHSAHWNIALMHLLHGNFDEGWKGFEHRSNKEEMSTRLNLIKPIWNGSDITGQTILLIAEYGLGDTIHFIRYASLLAQQDVNVICVCQNELSALLKKADGISLIIPVGEAIPEFNVYSPLLSLPSVFKTTVESIPSKVPYIYADPSEVQKWQDRLRNAIGRIKVGLVWAGLFPEKKSVSFDLFSPLLKLDNITFYSLQKGEASVQTKHFPRGVNFIDFTDAIEDLSDTAAVIMNLDLVISVDTSVAHLAGALAKPVWNLLPFSPDWRWMLNREDSPWYPTMRLFRQPAPGDWGSVIAKVEDELLKLLGNH